MVPWLPHTNSPDCRLLPPHIIHSPCVDFLSTINIPDYWSTSIAAVYWSGDLGVLMPSFCACRTFLATSAKNRSRTRPIWSAMCVRSTCRCGTSRAPSVAVHSPRSPTWRTTWWGSTLRMLTDAVIVAVASAASVTAWHTASAWDIWDMKWKEGILFWRICLIRQVLRHPALPGKRTRSQMRKHDPSDETDMKHEIY